MAKTPEILEAVYALCPEILDGNTRCRGTIPVPTAALTRLGQRFTDRELIPSRVVTCDRYGELQIAAKLCQPGGAVVALRTSEAEPPFDLLTERGSVTGTKHPVLSGLKDHRREKLAEETGVMLIARRLKDVAWLDHFDLPATHGFGLSGLSFSACRAIDETFGEGLPRFAFLPEPAERKEPPHPTEKSESDADNPPNEEHLPSERDQPAEPVDNQTQCEDAERDDSPAYRPMLVLWDGLQQRNQPTIWLRSTVAHLLAMRRYAGLPLLGVWVYQPDEETLTGLRFAFEQQDRALIRGVLLQSLTSLMDLESIVKADPDASPTRPDYLTSRRTVLEKLIRPAEEAALGTGHGEALEDYDAAVQRELAEPLVAWALKSHSPTARVAGTQLAEIVSLLHQLTPRLQALQADQLSTFPGQGESVLEGSPMFQQYLQLLDRFSHLTMQITRLMKP